MQNVLKFLHNYKASPCFPDGELYLENMVSLLLLLLLLVFSPKAGYGISLIFCWWCQG